MKIILLPALLLVVTFFTGCVDDHVGVVAVGRGPGYYGRSYDRDVYVDHGPSYRRSYDRDYDRRAVVVNDRTNVTRVNRTTNVTNVAVNKNKRVVNKSQPTVVVNKKKKNKNDDDDRKRR